MSDSDSPVKSNTEDYHQRRSERVLHRSQTAKRGRSAGAGRGTPQTTFGKAYIIPSKPTTRRNSSFDLRDHSQGRPFNRVPTPSIHANPKRDRDELDRINRRSNSQTQENPNSSSSQRKENPNSSEPVILINISSDSSTQSVSFSNNSKNSPLKKSNIETSTPNQSRDEDLNKTIQNQNPSSQNNSNQVVENLSNSQSQAENNTNLVSQAQKIQVTADTSRSAHS